MTASRWQLELLVKQPHGHNFILWGSWWGSTSLASSGLRVFAGVCVSHIRAVPHDEIKTREEISHTKSWIF